MSESGIIDIHGKQYKTVAKRVDEFRSNVEFEGWTIESSIIEISAEKVVMQCVIKDRNARTIATGFAEEVRTKGGVNSTSALENAETSAVGRCLAFLGFGGAEIASAEEAADALIKQAKNDALKWFASYQALVNENLQSILCIKESLSRGEYSSAKEAWLELNEEEQIALWLAPSKGGIFTTEERKQMKDDQWSAA